VAAYGANSVRADGATRNLLSSGDILFEEVCHDGHSDFDRLLHEVQGPARNQRPQADYDEERPTRDRRLLPGLRHEDLQDRRRQVESRAASVDEALLEIQAGERAGSTPCCNPCAVPCVCARLLAVAALTDEVTRLIEDLRDEGVDGWYTSCGKVQSSAPYV
jgi:hypothetical protein